MTRSDSRSYRPRLEALEDRCVPANVGTPTQNFVDQVYRDVLHRAPDPGGLAAWTSGIESGQFNRQEIVLQIQGSQEGLRTQVNDLYLRYLRRPADPVGLAGWTNFLRTNDLTDLEAQLLGSPEYFQTQGGGTNAGFVQALYLDVLGRAASSAEVSARVSGLDDASDRRDLAEEVLESPEADRARVNNTYASYLRRTGDPGGVDFWARLLRNDDLDETLNEDRVPDAVEDDDEVILVSALLASPEYFQLAQTLGATSFATIPGSGGGTPAPTV